MFFTLLAQTTQPVFDPNAPASTYLGSVAAIIFLTWQLTGWTKEYIVTTQFKKWPVSILTLLYSVGLTALAVYVTHTMSGPFEPLLFTVLGQTFASMLGHTDSLNPIQMLFQSIESSVAQDNAGKGR
jgi:hypothetical protein